MGLVADGNERQLTALLIAPDRELARKFNAASPAACGFQILAELKAYPAERTLAIRLRQLEPEVVLLDFATDFEQAAEVIRLAIAINPTIHVVGLHGGNDSDAILRAHRQGASEFLCAPFEQDAQREAVGRIRRLIEPRQSGARKPGTVIAFTSAKPGSGASTVATRLALALARTAPDRVLLADLDPAAATAGFFLELGDCRGPSAGDPWECLITRADGLHALPAGAFGRTASLRELLERARGAYDWIVVDLPAVFHRSSLLALPESDRAFLVTTADLASLHLARKALGLLLQLGFGKDRVRVLVNRIERRTGLQRPDVEKILNLPVDRSFPLERFAGGRAGAPLDPAASGSDLGKEIAEFAAALAAFSRPDRPVETEA